MAESVVLLLLLDLQLAGPRASLLLLSRTANPSNCLEVAMVESANSKHKVTLLPFVPPPWSWNIACFCMVGLFWTYSGWHCVAVKVLHPQVRRSHQNSFHLAPHENVAWTCMNHCLSSEAKRGHIWSDSFIKSIPNRHKLSLAPERLALLPENGNWWKLMQSTGSTKVSPHSKPQPYAPKWSVGPASRKQQLRRCSLPEVAFVKQPWIEWMNSWYRQVVGLHVQKYLVNIVY